MTSNDTEEPALEPHAGERALEALEARLRAIPAAQLTAHNIDVAEAAVVALSLVDVARAPARQARLALLPDALFARNTVDELEQAAWAAWHAHARLRTESAGATTTRVDPALFDETDQHLARMLRVLAYHVGDRADVAAELADIRSGSGYQDRAQDLVRAARLFEQHHALLAADLRHYRADDAREARRLSELILADLRASLGKSAAAWADLRARAFHLMARRYDDVRAAGSFVFREEPEQLALFVPLRQAVLARRGRPRREPSAPVATDSR